MHKNYEVVRSSIREYTRELQKIQPDTINAFYAQSKAALKDGALSEKIKEYIALAIGVAKHCDGCIAFHVKNLNDLGATREEIAEVLGVGVYMGGGPSLMLAADALRAFDQLHDEESIE
ncbi:carboxymuconolactone decarboxylase family protein [Teredinibacter sp. KSP-S5-2]|uniref:carboxymuconolactone decarboxylase family protein n=1 Tax=Teredinibacter sp. KSP-S5-2 TaxID=3034506 RepID=UPI0029349635|nr:carboxymuconolactone decarboxylase family protein [Teredinibacter sp. KSP-S5-2]WNO10669.1 carboxymuconolactone decarboxylase family protein [Teredinibacter sp. KSP-S5-2]